LFARRAPNSALQVLSGQPFIGKILGQSGDLAPGYALVVCASVHIVKVKIAFHLANDRFANEPYIHGKRLGKTARIAVALHLQFLN
jgi:hypothetical protein